MYPNRNKRTSQICSPSIHEGQLHCAKLNLHTLLSDTGIKEACEEISATSVLLSCRGYNIVPAATATDVVFLADQPRGGGRTTSFALCFFASSPFTCLPPTPPLSSQHASIAVRSHHIITLGTTSHLDKHLCLRRIETFSRS